jgi:uncharacterized membrane protein
MNNIQKAGQYFMCLFYTLLTSVVVNVLYYLKIKNINNDSGDNFEMYTNIYIVTISFILFAFLVFLYLASKTLMKTEDFESEDEILTSGERMKRMMENSDANNL